MSNEDDSVECGGPVLFGDIYDALKDFFTSEVELPCRSSGKKAVQEVQSDPVGEIWLEESNGWLFPWRIVRRTQTGATGYADNKADPWEIASSTSRTYSFYATYTASGGSDTCTYSGSGDHQFLYSDNCYITSDISVNGTCYLHYDAAGSFGSQANINCQKVIGDAGFRAVFKQGYNFNEY